MFPCTDPVYLVGQLGCRRPGAVMKVRCLCGQVVVEIARARCVTAVVTLSTDPPTESVRSDQQDYPKEARHKLPNP